MYQINQYLHDTDTSFSFQINIKNLIDTVV